MRFTLIHNLLFIGVLALTSCEEDNSRFTQLENAVLEHYRSTGDSIKLKAARFLLNGLYMQEFLTHDQGDSIVRALYATDGYNRPQIDSVLIAINTYWKESGRKTRSARHADIERLTAEGFIENIDLAFAAWENTPWQDEYSFDLFCDYVLPYKCGSGAPQEEWRDMYYDELAWLRDSVSRANSPEEAVRYLRDSTRGWYRYTIHIGPNTFGPVDLWETQAGHCVQQALWRVLACRSVGIPTCYIYTNHWANHNQGHAWVGGPDTTGKIVSYQVDMPRHALLPAKLNTYLYRISPTSLEANAPELKSADIPPNVEGINLFDVTADLIPVTDVEVTLQDPSKAPNDYAYLSLFNIGGWHPIHWARIEGGQAVFNDMGRQAVYLPSYYEDGETIPAADPHIVNFDGGIERVTFDTSDWRSVRLTRKYPLRPGMFHYCKHMMNSVIETSDDQEFSNPRVIYQIPRTPGDLINVTPDKRDRYYYHEYWDSTQIETNDPARFVRLRANDDKHCFVGELEFYTPEGDRIHGVAFGNASEPGRIQDGFYGQAYRDTVLNSWVAVDFGSPKRIGKIKWLPSNDSNSIQVGDEYELMAWDGQKWISLGKQIADKTYLDYRIPKQGLLWLKCLTRGEEERPFVFDDASGLEVFY